MFLSSKCRAAHKQNTYGTSNSPTGRVSIPPPPLTRPVALGAHFLSASLQTGMCTRGLASRRTRTRWALASVGGRQRGLGSPRPRSDSHAKTKCTVSTINVNALNSPGKDKSSQHGLFFISSCVLKRHTRHDLTQVGYIVINKSYQVSLFLKEGRTRATLLSDKVDFKAKVLSEIKRALCLDKEGPLPRQQALEEVGL